jgi:DNA-binding beta-propeller fold protein YncE
MYIGSTEGNVYVLNIETMQIETSIPVGFGAGHTTFAPMRNIAIVTNHKDTFVSIIDTTTHTLIKNVTVSEAQINGEILQSHTSFIHPDMNHFYAFATDNGIFYELDLETLEVTRTLNTGGTPLQGVYLCDGQNCSSM